ncbi:MAG: nucleoside-diphosphate kinase [Minisyncoccia bacterium]
MKTEKTFVIIKPDGIQRSLIGEVVKRFERVGMKLVAMKMLVPSAEIVERHYTNDPEWLRKVGEKTIEGYKAKNITPPSDDPIENGKNVLRRLSIYMKSGPIVLMVWQGAHAVKIVRKIIGSTEPLNSDVGTIRGDFVMDSYILSGADDRSVRNIVHASGSPSEAEDEIKIWFDQKEILNYHLIQEAILYDVNLDGILE